MDKQELLSINPANGKIIGRTASSSSKDVEDAVCLGHTAQTRWHKIGLANRCDYMRKLCHEFTNNSDELANLITIEMGMPIRQARLFMKFGIETLEAYIAQSKQYLAPEIITENDNEIHIIYRDPIGVLAAISPWNYPMGNFVWQCGQALLAGNAVVYKVSEMISLFGKKLESVVTAVLPQGVFQEVYGDAEIGKKLVDSNIDGVRFTGSTKAGVDIQKSVSGRLLPTNLELGGSAPGIVFDDVNIAETAKRIVALRFDNSGQVCDGLKRLIVQRSVADKIIAGIIHELSMMKIGDPLDYQTDFGPLASKQQYDIANLQVADAIKKGSTIVYSYGIPGNGYFFAPTILANVTNDTAVWQSETFAPVLPVMLFDDEEEAVNLANDTKYGLGGYVFTNNASRFMRIAKRVDTSMISQNSILYIQHKNFFGGRKMSGIGQENGKYGFENVTIKKLISRCR